ncbi:SCO1860 family LAETG-anchored protein [Streptomyces sp. NPDC002308]
MNSNTFRLAALAVAAAPVALFAAFPAQAAAPATTGGDEGKASAVVLRTALDVSLANKTVDVPLKATLNEVNAPESAEKTALSVKLDGVADGPVKVLRADVATSGATVDARRAEGHSNLVKARVQVPGLPFLPLIEVEKVTSKAVCEVGKKPVASSNVLGHVTVLGKRITLTAGGRTEVDVPGAGNVTLDLSKTSTTSKTAAAAALQLRISLNPGKLNVADVQGEVTLAEATCTTPGSGHGGSGGGSGHGGSGNGGSGHGGSGHGGSGNGGHSDGGSGDGGSDDGGTDDGGATTGDGGTTGDTGSTEGGYEDGGATDGGASGDGSTGDTATSGATTGDTSGSTGSTDSTSGGDTTGGDVTTQTGADNTPATVSGDDLAETGSSSSTPLIAGGAALLLALGAGATVLARKRARD